MSLRGPIMDTEPAAVISGIAGVLTAAIGAAVVFGVDWTDEQQAAATALVIALAGFAHAVTGLLIRSRVASPATVARIAPDAVLADGQYVIPPGTTRREVQAQLREQQRTDSDPLT